MTINYVKLSYLPNYFFTAKAEELHQYMENLSLFFIDGKRKLPIFVSVLLHGNEHTGWYALQKLFRQLLAKNKNPSRSIILLVGNVEAAAKNIRCLDGSKDFNRVWQGTCEGKVAKRIKAIMKIVAAAQPRFAIDIHNTSGKNIHYGCVPNLDNQHLQLAKIFSRVVVYVKRPNTTLMNRMSSIAPSVTLECGQSCEAQGIDHAKEFLESCLKISELPTHRICAQDIMLLETQAILQIQKKISFCFEGDVKSQNADLVLRSNLDEFNFSEIKKGEKIGNYQTLPCLNLHYVSQRSLTNQHLHFQDGEITLKKDAYFAMLSTDKDVIQKDCLGYLMKEIPLPSD